MLDTGAEHSLFANYFVKKYSLNQVKSKIKTLILADQLRVTMDQQVDAIRITLGYTLVKIGGLVCPNLSIDIIAGLAALVEANHQLGNFYLNHFLWQNQLQYLS